MLRQLLTMRSLGALCVLSALAALVINGCKNLSDAPNRRFARRVAMKQAAVDGSVFKSNRLANTSVDSDVAAATSSSDSEYADTQLPGDVVTDDGGFVPDATTPNDSQGGKTDGKTQNEADGKAATVDTTKANNCGSKLTSSPSQTPSKTGDCSSGTKSPENPPVVTTQTTPQPSTPSATPTPTPTTPSTTTTPPTTANTPPTAVTPSQETQPPPPKETCNMFVHLRGHKPEWTAVFIPAQKIAPNQLDEAIFGIAKYRMPNCAWPAQRSCVKGSYTYDLDTNGQPGSTDCQAVYSKNYSPLIIDMIGKGILLSHPKEGVKFDIEGTGEKLPISWPVDAANTPFLVLDVNGNGNIDSVHELFGNNTKGPDGKTSDNGFLALAKYDQNRDKIIDAKDSVWMKLRFWRDLNRNGSAEAGELSALPNNRIIAIDLDFVNKQENADVYGNSTLQRSVVEMRSGKMRSIFDLWFVPGMSQ